MAQDFDYFLILSALAFLLVVVLIVRTLKPSKDKTKPVRDREPAPAKRSERIAARPITLEDRLKARVQLDPVKPRIIRIELYSENQPAAVISLSSVGALAWGNPQTLSRPFEAFLKKYLRAENGESILVHKLPQNKSDAFLSAVLFDNQDGVQRLAPEQTYLKAEDLPAAGKTEALLPWLKGKLHAATTELFFRLAEIEQARVFCHAAKAGTSLELTDEASEELKRYEALCALSAALLSTGYDQQARALNRYWQCFAQFKNPQSEEESTLEHLVFSQIFVQTQKLPIFFVITPTSSRKCYNALNF